MPWSFPQVRRYRGQRSLASWPTLAQRLNHIAVKWARAESDSLCKRDRRLARHLQGAQAVPSQTGFSGTDGHTIKQSEASPPSRAKIRFLFLLCANIFLWAVRAREDDGLNTTESGQTVPVGTWLQLLPREFPRRQDSGDSTTTTCVTRVDAGSTVRSDTRLNVVDGKVIEDHVVLSADFIQSILANLTWIMSFLDPEGEPMTPPTSKPSVPTATASRRGKRGYRSPPRPRVPLLPGMPRVINPTARVRLAGDRHIVSQMRAEGAARVFGWDQPVKPRYGNRNMVPRWVWPPMYLYPVYGWRAKWAALTILCWAGRHGYPLTKETCGELKRVIRGEDPFGLWLLHRVQTQIEAKRRKRYDKRRPMKLTFNGGRPILAWRH